MISRDVLINLKVKLQDSELKLDASSAEKSVTNVTNVFNEYNKSARRASEETTSIEKDTKVLSETMSGFGRATVAGAAAAGVSATTLVRLAGAVDLAGNAYGLAIKASKIYSAATAAAAAFAKGLSAAQILATSATAARATAEAAATLTTTALTVATVSLGVAVRFLLGPVGLALLALEALAAAAAFAFSKMKAAEAEADELAQSKIAQRIELREREIQLIARSEGLDLRSRERGALSAADVAGRGSLDQQIQQQERLVKLARERKSAADQIGSTVDVFDTKEQVSATAALLEQEEKLQKLRDQDARKTIDAQRERLTLSLRALEAEGRAQEQAVTAAEKLLDTERRRNETQNERLGRLSEGKVQALRKFAGRIEGGEELSAADLARVEKIGGGSFDFTKGAFQKIGAGRREGLESLLGQGATPESIAQAESTVAGADAAKAGLQEKIDALKSEESTLKDNLEQLVDNNTETQQKTIFVLNQLNDQLLQYRNELDALQTAQGGL